MSASNLDHNLTPCAGRCSTVFGDSVCRGCRRFNHEVIQWNTYGRIEKNAVWMRLDHQLDQVLVPMLPFADVVQVEQFIQSKRIRLKQNASLGRKLYYVLKLCEKNLNFTDESGLGLKREEVKLCWRQFEQKILALANASYELAYIRAGGIQRNLVYFDDE